MIQSAQLDEKVNKPKYKPLFRHIAHHLFIKYVPYIFAQKMSLFNIYNKSSIHILWPCMDASSHNFVTSPECKP